MALSFGHYLDTHRPEDKMCISNGEWEDISRAFVDLDWGKIIRYAEKYQPKQEWSEEDEKRVKQLIYDTEAIRAGYEKRKERLGERFNNELIKDCDEQIAWLKSLRPSWKPSEEQMSALNYFIKLWGNSDDQLEYTKIFNTVKSLRDELKKLM